jgi:hypothetical protein
VRRKNYQVETIVKNFFFFFLFPFTAFAAAPFTHLILAEKFLECSAPVDEIQKRDFMAGNLFPDIRHLGEISRTKTHEKGLTLQDVGHSSSPFTTGMRLHAFVDEVREHFALKSGIYDELEAWGPQYRASLLKFIEDEIFYDWIEPCCFVSFFEEVLEEELAWGSSLSCTEEWHRFCQGYLRDRPSAFLLQLAEQQRPFFSLPPHLVQVWSEEIPRLASQEVFRNYVRDLMDHFSFLFSENKPLK